MTEEYSQFPLSPQGLSVLSKLFPSNSHISSPARTQMNQGRPNNIPRGIQTEISELAGDIKSEDKHEYMSSIIINNVNQSYHHLTSGLNNIQDSYYHSDTQEIEDFDLNTSELEEGQVLDILSDLTFSDDSKHSTCVLYNQASLSFKLVSQANLSTRDSTIIQATHHSKWCPSKLQNDVNSPINDTEELPKLKSAKNRQASLISVRFSQHSVRKYCKVCDCEVMTSVSFQLKKMNL